MFEPSNSVVALLLCFTATIGWGTLNNAVLCTKSPPGVFHLNLMIWRFLWALLLGAIFGASFFPPNDDSILKNLKDVFSAPWNILLSRLGATFVAGFTDMLFQIFILGGISSAGLSNSIPLQIGMATVFGSTFTFLIERKGRLVFFIPGLCLNVVAIAFNSVTFNYLRKDQESDTANQALLESDEGEMEKVKAKISIWKLMGICILGALMAMFWAPSTTIAGSDPHPLNSYSTAIIVSFWSAITAAPFSYISMRHPFVGEAVNFKDWLHTTWKDLFPAIWGGLFWAIGTYGYCLGAPKIGFAVAYVLSQSTPFISSLYAIFLWKEFKNASKKTWVYESLMLLTMALSVLCLCFAKTPS